MQENEAKSSEQVPSIPAGKWEYTAVLLQYTMKTLCTIHKDVYYSKDFIF